MDFNKLYQKIIQQEQLTVQEQYLISVAFVELEMLWKNEFRRLEKQYGTIFSAVMCEGEKEAKGKQRLKKGELDRKLSEHFDTSPTKGFTIAEIVAATGLNFNSVRNVLTRDTERYKKGSDNLWKKI